MLQILAALTFFTRLPFWKLVNIPSEYFKRVVPYWPLTGWITSGISVLVLYLSAIIFPDFIAIVLAISSRLLLTGCLHEDGLADFFDGFGGGNTKEKILKIMKDSHIGSYGVIGLIFYFLLYSSLLSSLDISFAGMIMLVADPYSKAVAAMTINRLPYARTEEEAKNKMVYSRMNTKEMVICLLAGLLPFGWLCPDTIYYIAAISSFVVWFLFTSYIKKKIEGYTGDCCGAIFLICELSFYLTILAIYHY